MKICANCNLPKLPSDFKRSSNTPDKLSHNCGACTNAYRLIVKWELSLKKIELSKMQKKIVVPPQTLQKRKVKRRKLQARKSYEKRIVLEKTKIISLVEKGLNTREAKIVIKKERLFVKVRRYNEELLAKVNNLPIDTFSGIVLKNMVQLCK